MNSNNVWSEEQIKAYAAAFRCGDALSMHDEWFEVKVLEDEVVKDGHVAIGLPTDEISFKINYREENSSVFNGIAEGFVADPFEYYKVVSTFDYQPQEFDKLVWVGKTGKDNVGTEKQERFFNIWKIIQSS